MIASIVSRNPKIKRRARSAAIGLFVLFSNPFLSNQALSALEQEPVELKEVHDIGIVLSGILNAGFDAQGQDQLNENADRLTEAIKLYKQGQIKKILISGGAADILYPDYNEGLSMLTLSQTLGVAANDLILENRSRNTHENALYSADLLKGKPRSVVLITSAFHMRRARACFQKQGLEFTEYPADFKGQKTFKWKYMVPSSHAFQNWNIVNKELVGLVMYQLMGYI